MNSLGVYKKFNAVFQYTYLYILIWLLPLANPQLFVKFYFFLKMPQKNL